MTKLLKILGVLVALLSAATVQGQEWELVKSVGGVNFDESNAILVDKQGNTYITGYFFGTATFGSTSLTSVGESDIFLVKFDASGNVVFAKRAGGIGSEEGNGIAIDENLNCYITGYFQATATFGLTNLISAGENDIFVAKYDASGNVLWAMRAGGIGVDESKAIAIDGSGHPYLTGRFQGSANFGSTTLLSAGNSDFFISKLDSLGNVQFTKQGGD